MIPAGVTVLVLAGRRGGQADPLAQAAGTPLKCLAPVAGRPMILHVLDALAAAPCVSDIRISVDMPVALMGLPEIRALADAGQLRLLQARDNIADSVTAALAGARWPVIVTTADNVMLTPAAITAFATAAAGADIAVAFARRDDVLAAHPEAQRRFYRFSCGAYSNCNTYWIGGPGALGPVEAFREGGQFAKHPARIARAFGILNLVRFRLGIGTLAAAFRRFSRRYGHTLRPVVLGDGALAVDVDNARTLGIAETLLRARREQGGSTTPSTPSPDTAAAA